MNLADEIRQQIEKNKELKLDVGAINNRLSILEGLVRKDIEERVNEAYQRGYDDATKIISSDEQGIADKAYQRGLNDAWEAARNISMLESDGGYSWKEMKSIFGTDSASEIYVRHTAAEAINKIKAYEEKQKAEDEIKVGDEVAFHHDDKPDTVVVVTYIGQDGYIDGMDGRGTQYAHKNPTKWTKTGRHFNIASILEDMRND